MLKEEPTILSLKIFILCFKYLKFLRKDGLVICTRTKSSNIHLRFCLVKLSDMPLIYTSTQQIKFFFVLINQYLLMKSSISVHFDLIWQFNILLNQHSIGSIHFFVELFVMFIFFKFLS